jgi:dTDP-4-dehydrorhamnose reductase
VRILLTGAGGQLGRMVQEVAGAAGHQVVPFGHAALAIEDAAAVRRAMDQVRPQWILNAAAMTDVDGCEARPAQAQGINAAGPENLARAAAATGCRLVQVSTDYVFDGERPGGRYREGDVPNPVSVYGASKLDGERRAMAALPSTLVARTAVVWGPHKSNFVTWVRDSLAAGKPLRIVQDQWVSPTHTHDLSRQLLALMAAGAEGVWHTAGADRLSRLEMAQAIAATHGFDVGGIEAIRMQDLTWKARRPRDSSLDVSKVSRLARPEGFATTLGWEVPA